ncbi:hypothetical protein BC827DRAFT_655262 [Russula dissimulans]|nr:hypothetical protein BC827DRAFT_655262 [Russula dissimulans]
MSVRGPGLRGQYKSYSYGPSVVRVPDAESSPGDSAMHAALSSAQIYLNDFLGLMNVASLLAQFLYLVSLLCSLYHVNVATRPHTAA